MKTRNVDQKLAVITGGSSGLGLAIGEALANEGFDLLLIARDELKLTSVKRELTEKYKVKIHIASIDVTNPKQVSLLRDIVLNIAPSADLVVNSAGIVSAGLLVETPLEEWDRLYAFNVKGVVSVLQTLLPDMLIQSENDGVSRHIVNIASASSVLNLAGMAAYSATKAGVITISETLAHELHSKNIGVTAVCPEFVKTPIGSSLKLFGRMDSPRSRKQVQKMFEKSTITPAELAQRTLDAVSKNSIVIMAGRQASLANVLKRIAPNLFFKLIHKLFSSSKQ
ncbi:SDR family NAD(P)-dependent oxidoreductase [Glaciecola petra]|uniref:SDR family NAD(P)-dependent oxidoreductase n=1 Tax=Glaciecola petra TaxID=3075602 RepID=A0ABU2ZVP3_9ALTE|nr:SDR family NAD(P)-dependent oxidoreductase [Aestuariibacter sp. P117]MDT0596480.1 SDR family NAD(P)-dependent oxidoreductase [Aestuariibacter sp. P117]